LRNYGHQRVFLRKNGSDRYTFTEIFEQQVYAEVANRLQTCSTMLDLGANIGLASLYFLARFPELKIVAIEANPATFAVLEQNLKEYVASGRARIVQGAVWERDGFVVGDDHGKSRHYSAFAVKELEAGTGPQARIYAYSMASIMQLSGFEICDLVKMDIEGAEVQCFDSETDWLRRTNCVAVEFHRGSREATRFDSLVKQYGMTIVGVSPHTVIARRMNQD